MNTTPMTPVKAFCAQCGTELMAHFAPCPRCRAGIGGPVRRRGRYALPLVFAAVLLAVGGIALFALERNGKLDDLTDRYLAGSELSFRAG